MLSQCYFMNGNTVELPQARNTATEYKIHQLWENPESKQKETQKTKFYVS